MGRASLERSKQRTGQTDKIKRDREAEETICTRRRCRHVGLSHESLFAHHRICSAAEMQFFCTSTFVMQPSDHKASITNTITKTTVCLDRARDRSMQLHAPPRLGSKPAPKSKIEVRTDC